MLWEEAHKILACSTTLGKANKQESVSTQHDFAGWREEFPLPKKHPFQMFKLVLEKAEESEIKLPTPTGSLKKQERSRKNIYFCFIDYAKAFDCVDHNKLWKILKEMGVPDQLTCLLRNLYAGQKATVRTGHGTTGWFQIGKGVCQGCIIVPLPI